MRKSHPLFAAISGLILGAAHITGAFYDDRLRASPPAFLTVVVLPFASVVALTAIFLVWAAVTAPDREGRAAAARNGLWIGATSGLGYFSVGTYWLGHAFLYPDDTGYTLRAFIGGAGAMLILFPWWAASMALTGALRARLCRGSIWSAALLWAVGMSVADVLLEDLIFGISLGPISQVLLDTPMSLVFPYAGLYGGNMLLLLSAALAGASMASLTLPRALRPIGAIAGWSLLSAPMTLPLPAVIPRTDSPTIAVVQPAGAQRIRPTYFDRASWMADLDRLMSAPEAQRSAVIVLPEGAIPFDPALDESPQDLFDLLGRAPATTTVLYGYYHTVTSPDAHGSYPTSNRVAISRNGQLLGAYDKTHLVPFGEFMPFPFNWLGFSAMTTTSTGLMTGSRVETWNTGDVPPFSIIICYESALSGALSRETPDAEWYANPTSEVMLRDSLGAAVVARYARIRALETGKPIYRAAQTGWSEIVDSNGAVLASIPMHVSGVISAPLPPMRQTTFASTGYWPLYALWIALMGAALLLGRKSSRGYRGNSQHSGRVHHNSRCPSDGSTR